MAIPLKYNTASQEIPLGQFLDSGDGDAEEPSLTIANTDIKLWKNGATTLANKNSGGATYISNGVYYCVLDATDTNTYGPMVIFVHVTGALAVRVECVVMEANAYDALYAALGTGSVESNLVQMGASTQSATDLKDFADAGYDPATNKVQGVLLTDTVTTYTGNTPQTGDAYAVVNHVTYGNAQLVRSTTPANTLDVNATGEAGVDWANVGGQATAVNLSGTTTNLVNTATNLTTNNDKTGYSLTQTFPSNFADLAITVTTGQVTVGTNNDKTGYTASTVTDKTGYSISGTKTTLDALNDVAATDIVSTGAITTAAGAVSTVTNLTNAPTSGDLTATMKTSVNTEVADVLKTDTIAEMSQGAPPTTPTFEEAMMYLYMMLTKKIDVDSGFKEFYNTAGTVIWKKALSDDASNYIEANGQTGP